MIQQREPDAAGLVYHTMPEPFYQREGVKLWQGHVLDVLRRMPSESVQCCVTSPPYLGLRSYGIEPQVWGGDENCEHEWGEPLIQQSSGGPPESMGLGGGKATTQIGANFTATSSFCRYCGAWRGELGLEPDVSLYVAHLVEVFREVRRVLRTDGTFWLNIGDSMMGSGGAHKPEHRNPGLSKSAQRDGVAHGSSYGNYGRLRADSRDRDCLYRSLCDECQASLLARKLRISPERVCELAVGESGPIQEHTLWRDPCPDNSGCSHPQPNELSYHATADSQLITPHVGEQSPCAQVSTTGESSPQLQDEHSHCSNCGASLSGAHSLRLCAQVSVCMLVDSGQTDDCTQGTASPFAAQGHRNQCIGENCSLRVSLVEPPNIQPQYTTKNLTSASNLKNKDLMMVPARLALALQEDGWWLRADIIWHKPNPMPESVTDRPTRSHEYVFLLSKSGTYYYDAEAIREPNSPLTIEVQSHYRRPSPHKHKHADAFKHQGTLNVNGVPERLNGRNRRTVWTISTQPYREAHFAVMPEALVEPCILAGTSAKGACPQCGAPWRRMVEREPMVIRRSERRNQMGEWGRTQSSGTMVSPANATTIGWEPACTCNREDVVPCVVLDPFAGSGTTLSVASRLGRHAWGIELNESYSRLCIDRVRQLAMALGV